MTAARTGSKRSVPGRLQRMPGPSRRAELFAAALDRAAANGKAVFAEFQLLHPALVLCEIVGFAAQAFRSRWVGLS